MAVLDPRLLCITNLDVEIAISVKLFQEDAAMTRQITLSPEIYIEEADACLLKPHSVFILKYAGAYRVERITSEDDG